MASDDWDRAAEQLGLTVDGRTAITGKARALVGTIHGVDVSVRYRSADDSTETRYTVALPERVPIATVRPRWLPFLRGATDAFGNTDWRRGFVVRTSDPVAAELFLSGERRFVLEEMRAALGRRWRIRTDELRLTRPGRESADEIVETVSALVAWSKRLTPGHV